ncbi:hypothetical protein Tco_1140600, partial [Tanacetum coccineum]
SHVFIDSPYTLISSDNEEPSDAGSPRVVVYGYDGLPMHPVDPYVEAALQAPEQAPPSRHYVSGPEHPPSLSYVPDPEYPEYFVDTEVPIEDQPLPADASPVALSPGYIADSDLEEDQEDDPKEDPANYPSDEGDNDDDDDDDDSSDDDDDDEDDDVEEDEEEGEEEEEDHLAPVDSFVVPTKEPVPSAEDIEAFETNKSAPTPVPSPKPRTARIDELPEADTPLRNKAHFTTPTGRFEVEESSSVAAARQAGHTLAHTVDYGFIDTLDASICASEIRAITAVGVVNK